MRTPEQVRELLRLIGLDRRHEFAPAPVVRPEPVFSAGGFLARPRELPAAPLPEPAPRVPARLATADELQSCASAYRLHDKAQQTGWSVQTLYWESFAGTAGLAVRLGWGSPPAKPDVAAVWLRQPGKAWAFEFAGIPSGMAKISSNELLDFVLPPEEHAHQCYDEPCRREPYDRRAHGEVVPGVCACGLTTTDCQTNKIRKKAS